jgi:hypothetical protein
MAAGKPSRGRREGFAMAVSSPSPKMGRNLGEPMFLFDVEHDRT